MGHTRTKRSSEHDCTQAKPEQKNENSSHRQQETQGESQWAKRTENAHCHVKQAQSPGIVHPQQSINASVNKLPLNDAHFLKKHRMIVTANMQRVRHLRKPKGQVCNHENP